MWLKGELSLAYLTVDGADFSQHVEAAAEAGFSAAGLRILQPSHLSEHSSVVGNARETQRVKELCRDFGVRPMDAEVMTLQPSTNDKQIAAMVGTAAELGFRFVQTVVEDVDMSRASENLAALAEVANDAGLRIALEFMAFRPLNCLDAARLLIERSGARNVGLLIDALHLARSGGNPAAVASMPDDQVAMVQICDAPAAAPPFDELATEARSGRLHPGEGELWLGELLNAVPDGVPVSLEVPHPGFENLAFSDRAKLARSAFENFIQDRARR